MRGVMAPCTRQPTDVAVNCLKVVLLSCIICALPIPCEQQRFTRHPLSLSAAVQWQATCMYMLILGVCMLLWLAR